MLGAVFLFGLVVLAAFAIVGGLWALPVAAALSYAPYLGYAVFRRRPRLRPVRHFGVFALLWVLLTAFLAITLLLGSEFSAAGGPMKAYGVEVFATELLVVPLVAFVALVVGGELILFLVHTQLPALGPGERPPRSERGKPFALAAVSVALLGLSTCGYCGTMGALGRPRLEGGVFHEIRQNRAARERNEREMHSGPGAEALTAAGCDAVRVVTPATAQRIANRHGRASYPSLTTLSCTASTGPPCGSLAVAYSTAIGATADVGVDRRGWSGDRGACSGVYTASGSFVRELREEEVAFVANHPRARY